MRVGSFNEESGSYGRWMHLGCWRVPYKIQLGLPAEACKDPSQYSSALASMTEVLFCGFQDLSEADKALVVAHVMDRSNWAAPRNVKKDNVKAEAASSSSSSSSSYSSSSSSAQTSGLSTSVAISYERETGTALAPKTKGAFVMPVPGVNGAVADCLAGKTIVMTGVFPEIGGGAGLNLGKDRLKAMIERFGGRVTSSVSGKTDILIVGHEPGMGKMSRARSTPGVQLLTTETLKDNIEGRLALANAPPVIVDSFSQGYTFKSGLSNGRVLSASVEEIDIARGVAAPVLPVKATKAPKAKKEPVPKVCVNA